MSLRSALQAARDAAKLSSTHLAALAKVDHGRLESFERGEVVLSGAEVDRCARALGLRLDDLELWTGTAEPLSVLLRASVPDTDLTTLLATEIHVALGEFQRTARNIAALEAALGTVPKKTPEIPSKTASYGGQRGEELAQNLRDYLELGIEPVASMRRLVESLGILVVWVTTNHLDSSVDGASTSAPRPVILANLLETNRYPWRARTTLAHELCHILFDHHKSGTMFSPARSTGIKYQALEELETVARAFSACFLAPSEGVQHVVDSLDPCSEDAIRRVGETYGVGRQVVINRLSRVFRLSQPQRAKMEERAPQPYAADFSGDEVAVVDGFRGDPLRGLVRRSLVAQKIRPAHARRMLGLAPTDPLPFAELGELAAPVVSRMEAIRRAAQDLLRDRYAETDLEAVHVEQENGFFRVEVFDGGIGSLEAKPRGHIDVTLSGAIKNVCISLPPSG